MIFFASLLAFAFTVMFLVIPKVPSAFVYTWLGLSAAGMVVAGVAFVVTPATSTTSSYALRPLTTAGGSAPAYLSVAGDSTTYAYDDNGTIRTRSTTAEQKVEIREDGDNAARVEVVQRESRNELFYPGDKGYSDSFVFHIPAGSPLTR